MKKKIILLLSTILLITCFFITPFKVYADEPNKTIVKIKGYSYVIVEPDNANLNFSIRARENTFYDLQNTLNKKFENFKNSLNEFNNIVINKGHNSIYSSSENGICFFEGTLDINVNTNLNNIDKIISIAGKQDITNMYYSNFSKTEIESQYYLAFDKAAQNAINTANKLYKNVVIKKIEEESIYNYNDKGKIKIHANVIVEFEVEI